MSRSHEDFLVLQTLRDLSSPAATTQQPAFAARAFAANEDWRLTPGPLNQADVRVVLGLSWAGYTLYGGIFPFSNGLNVKVFGKQRFSIPADISFAFGKSFGRPV